MAQGKDDSGKRPLCFVIGPIGKDGTAERKHADLLLHSLIKEVLETDEFGYRVKRADEDADPGMIGDRVITDIIQADLVIADLTDLNPNAFYELGIRHSTERSTIHVARAGTALPFDNVAHRTIFVDLTDWHSTVEARARLAASARAIHEPGFKVSNPITQANASFKMRESADPNDVILAELRDRMSALESRQRSRRAPQPAVGPSDDLSQILADRVRALRDTGIRAEEARGYIVDAARILGIHIDNFEIKKNKSDETIIEFSYSYLTGSGNIAYLWFT